MATKKPAETKPAAESKPATEKPAATTEVTIKDLATTLGRDPKSVRASIRKIKGGAQVGQGGRYRWNSKEDPEYKSLLTQLQSKGKKETEEVTS